MTDKERFEWARDKIVGTEREKQGIGTLSEKTVHAVLKNFYAPDEDMHEIPIEGCVADIYTGTEIVEIQTRNFDRMRDKLGKFLPLYPVTIVYPIPYEKWLIWIDEETGEFSSRRKSPVKGNPYVAFKELYRIKNFLLDENLHLKFVFINMEEYRLLNGWSRDRKKGSSRFDRIPLELVEIMDIDCPRDYLQLVSLRDTGAFYGKGVCEGSTYPGEPGAGGFADPGLRRGGGTGWEKRKCLSL